VTGGCIAGAIPYNSAMRISRLSLFFLILLSSLITGCNALTPSRDSAPSAGSGWQACDAERPKVCTMIYDPVCARRSTGDVADYASPCNACADVTVTAWHPETCEE
jgi:hypothetical protein